MILDRKPLIYVWRPFYSVVIAGALWPFLRRVKVAIFPETIEFRDRISNIELRQHLAYDEIQAIRLAQAANAEAMAVQQRLLYDEIQAVRRERAASAEAEEVQRKLAYDEIQGIGEAQAAIAEAAEVQRKLAYDEIQAIRGAQAANAEAEDVHHRLLRDESRAGQKEQTELWGAIERLIIASLHNSRASSHPDIDDAVQDASSDSPTNTD